MSNPQRLPCLVVHETGTNRDLEAAQALQAAGGDAEIVHLNQLRRNEKRWSDYRLLALPGGFSYADALGAAVSGDYNPVHVNEEYAKRTFFKGRITHGLMPLCITSATMSACLPGVIVWLSESTKFLAPVRIGDTLTGGGEVTAARKAAQQAVISWSRNLDKSNMTSSGNGRPIDAEIHVFVG